VCLMNLLVCAVWNRSAARDEQTWPMKLLMRLHAQARMR
jgi:hypothetical protein